MLDLERFDRDRRSDAVRARVRRDFESGVRAGVVTTPTVFAGGRIYTGEFDPAVLAGGAADKPLRRAGLARARGGSGCARAAAERRNSARPRRGSGRAAGR